MTGIREFPSFLPSLLIIRPNCPVFRDLYYKSQESKCFVLTGPGSLVYGPSEARLGPNIKLHGRADLVWLDLAFWVRFSKT